MLHAVTYKEYEFALGVANCELVFTQLKYFSFGNNMLQAINWESPVHWGILTLHFIWREFLMLPTIRSRGKAY